MTSSFPSTLGIDFGTSNSAMALRVGPNPARLIPLEGEMLAMPTALFFHAEELSTHYGRDAMGQYLEGEEGRLMRSLKSLLGSALLQDKTVVHGNLVSYQDIIALFLRHLATRAQKELGQMPERVVLGRPVYFVDDDPERDALAESALREAAHRAGFAQVQFQLEPIAAALDYEQRLDRESVVLVVDIGGGTSDFTVVRLGPDRIAHPDRSVDVLATTGVHIGGTDFDQRLNLELLQPLLGLRHHGKSGREVPSRVFFDLSTWHLIQWLYTAKAVREAQNLRTDYQDERLHARLMTVLEERLGHRLANTMEQGKIAVSQTGSAQTLDLGWLENQLQAEATPEALDLHLQPALARVVACAEECLRRAGVTAQALDAIYLTGGSSALRPLRSALRAAFPDTPQVEGDLFGGVASGLAYTQA
ncbi:Hsp70 family protein [Acidovorax sp. CCYZU-2555]|uniref:Hsp70 family protein n=1 Tax=Acidovorax sp. CCYZU-2555 TaxID=2835042 RepID=UPI001BCA8002|nr:Hsp70 family protein [Acidovorax sp. CCYZU-2555]MBS7778605.1 Hsp70 family protein [Acidovorax sp. CCYZU-2555]